MTSVEPAGFMRRLGAIFYDSMLFGISVLLIGSVISSVAGHFLGYETVDVGTLFSKMLFIIQVGMLFLLFGWFWTHGGQTLGMRAWKIRIVTNNGGQLNWQQSFFRFAAALFSWAAFGVGFLIAIFDPEKKGWHDRFSKTRLVRI
uniref:FIG023103: Predicted transmembrane protein n=1 Tax=uncultured Thiotrichaceae bacterium TaxID=298394 RepID=A0A6S6UHU4_9GAMM|nr:MAG: FIG023103: Predicted transmembrane protein [uncultured Thiotrichaceae bacterium]